jgi:hypothetical protein
LCQGSETTIFVQFSLVVPKPSSKVILFADFRRQKAQDPRFDEPGSSFRRLEEAARFVHPPKEPNGVVAWDFRWCSASE